MSNEDSHIQLENEEKVVLVQWDIYVSRVQCISFEELHLSKMHYSVEKPFAIGVFTIVNLYVYMKTNSLIIKNQIQK